MLPRSFVAATALLISSLAYPVAQAAPQLLAQTQQPGGGSAGGGGGGGQMPSGGAGGANTPQTRGGDLDRGGGMRERSGMREGRSGEGMRDTKAPKPCALRVQTSAAIATPVPGATRNRPGRNGGPPGSA